MRRRTREERSAEARHVLLQAARLSEASLRISASLDIDTVLREVVDSARALTGARHGAVATIDDTGKPREFVTSGSGQGELRPPADGTGGQAPLELLRDLLGVPEHVRARHVPPGLLPPGISSLGMPMHHLDNHVGSLYLLEKENGQEFTTDDEDILARLAAQAAVAIDNARTYQAEQRARAGLEILVEASPVGVVVFDARSGNLVSLNHEAQRIVASLRVPNRPRDLPLEAITCRRADGREVPFVRFPASTSPAGGECVRAEELVLSAPDGHSITTLINATTIRSEDGAAASMVVTMQDLSPLEELERVRSELLGMVSHELRVPLTSIKGSAATLLRAPALLGQAEMREFFRIIDAQADHMRGLIADLLDAGRIDAGVLSVAPESSDLTGLVDQACNTFLSGGGRHAVLVDLPPSLPPVMADRQRVVQVLNNLFSNAAVHSPQSMPIRVAAELDGGWVAVSVSDEGGGVAPEHLPLLFRKYAGARDSARRVGGGLGLAICKGLVEAHGGRIRAASEGVGRGTCFTFTLPVAAVAEACTTRVQPPAPAQGHAPTPILVVDDDPQTLRFVRDALTGAGYTPLLTGDHRKLSGIIATERPALVLLDLVLPGADGIALMESVPGLSELPVMFISGYGRDETIARALEMGAADYVVKPFSAAELTARIRAVLRRRGESVRFVLGGLVIDYERRRVTVGGRTVELTPTEYELLTAMSLDGGRVSTYEALLRKVWGGRGNADRKSVRVVVNKLRRKLGDDAGESLFIKTVRGIGYRMPQAASRKPGRRDAAG